MFKDAATDTFMDQEDAKDIGNVAKKMEELDKIKEDVNKKNDDLDDFLKNIKAAANDIEESNADKNLKQVIKDMNAKKR